MSERDRENALIERLLRAQAAAWRRSADELAKELDGTGGSRARNVIFKRKEMARLYGMAGDWRMAADMVMTMRETGLRPANPMDVESAA